MAGAVQGPLNPEPAHPGERARLQLPPKSYKAAAENGLDSSDEDLSDIAANGTKPQAGSKRGSKKNRRKPMKRDDVNGDGQVQIEERHREADGHKLVTGKPDDFFEEDMALDKGSERRPKVRYGETELVSGRKAGTGWDRSKIRWAPLNLPLKRRLQTAMVLVHSLSIALFLTAFFLLAAIPITWPLLFPYTLYVLFSNKGSDGTLSRRSEFMRRLPTWSLFASYFPARLHRTAELPATRKYIFGYHPHGIISHGAFAAFVTEALGFSQLFPGITNTLLTLDSNFRIPLYRDYALSLGLGSVSRASCENLLSQGGANGEGMGRAVTIVVGGAAESLDARPGAMKLVLRRRKGFVRIAVRAGADLVPVVGFGENELYDQVRAETHPLLHRFQLLVKNAMGFTVPFFFARGVFNYDVGMMPFRRPLNIVVGRPIKVEQQTEPDPSYVEKLHSQYIDELTRVWEEWKGEFGEGIDALEIVE